MPALRPRARRTTIREVLDTAIELEKKTMALYVGFVKAFPRPAEVRNFWFSMARHEAGHCGALALVEGILESDPHRAAKTRVWFDPSTATRLRSLLSAYLREARGGVRLERAFEMAIDLEASELEDVVVDMMKVVKSPEWRERALQRYCRASGVALEDAVRMVRTGRRTGPERKPVARTRDRRQLTLPMQR